MSDLDPLWRQFSDRLSELGGHTVSLPLAEAAEGTWSLLHTLGIRAETVVVDPDAAELIGLSSTADVWQADVGVTTAHCAIAETGTVVLASGSGRSRLASVAPPCHVVIVHEAHIVASLEEAFASLPETNVVLITGPSRTADIEGELVRGVHGPKDVVVIRLRDAGQRS